MQDETTAGTGQEAAGDDLETEVDTSEETTGSAASAEVAPVADQLDAPPGEVSELANACIVYVQRALGFQLDFSRETLPVLDHYLRSARETHRERAELLEVVALPAGAYLGEVVRRVIPARWFAPPAEHARWRLELVHAFVAFNPMGAALEAMLGEEVPGWGAHLQLRPIDQNRVRPVLDQLPEVSLDEFLSPSSRLEILELITDHLGRGGEPRTYSAADYGPFRAEAIALGGGGGADPS